MGKWHPNGNQTTNQFPMFKPGYHLALALDVLKSSSLQVLDTPRVQSGPERQSQCHIVTMRFTKRGIFMYIWVYWNRGTPKSSILMGFSLMNHPFGGTPISGNPHIWVYWNYTPMNGMIYDMIYYTLNGYWEAL